MQQIPVINMMNRIDFKSQFWRFYLPVFMLFSISILAFQYNREKHYKAEMLDAKLGDSNEMIYYYLKNNAYQYQNLDSIISISPFHNIRFTIINNNGKVLYDNVIRDVSRMSNHAKREEILIAEKLGHGSKVRLSNTNQISYYYHADKYGDIYIRSSKPYVLGISDILSSDNLFLYFWLIITLLLVATMLYASNRFSIKMQKAQLDRDGQLRRQLTQEIAHELKTPLSTILGYLETLHNNPSISRERQQSFIDRSHSQAIRLTDLLQDILVLNQLNDAPRTVKKELIELNRVVEHVIEDVELKLEQKTIQIKSNLGEEIWLRANPLLLYSIFRNLLDNSIAYAGDNIFINILLVSEDAKFYYFEYSDTGSGVKNEFLPYLFERFYRVDKGRSRKTGGTGLGLAIVKNAVEFHEGKITVSNKNGGGLTFSFSLKK